MTTTAPSLDLFLHRVDECDGAARSRDHSLWAATASGVVDVMGVMAEPFGVQPLNMLLDPGVTIGIQLRNDRIFELVGLPTPNNGSARRVLLTVDQVSERNGVSRLRSQLPGDQAAWARPLAATLQGLLDRDWSLPLRSGCTVFVESPFASNALELGAYPTICACLQAARQACQQAPDPEDTSRLVHKSIRSYCDLAVETSPSVCVALGRRGALRYSGPADGAIPEWIEIPTGVAFVGVDCGVNPEEMADNYRRARLATLMGIRILDDTFASNAEPALNWRGRLSDITINDYVTRVRHRLPTKMKGSAFLERFGEVLDASLPIDPDSYYKIRSRTEHPIYEQARVRQLAGCLLNAVQSQRLASLLDAGDLMYASHWSYGQRCGMGSIVTDALVSALRKLGSAEGIYGARISGLGSGGIVTVLISDTESARTAVRNTAASVGARLKTPLHYYETSRPSSP